MSQLPYDAHLLRLAIAVVADIPEIQFRRCDVLVDVAADAHVRDLVRALALHIGLEPRPEYGLVRRLVSWSSSGQAPQATEGYLPTDELIGMCGLFDGVELVLRDREQYPAPDVFIDTDRCGTDLFLLDDRGTHRGRLTRLPDGVAVAIGSSPPTEHGVTIDDAEVADHAVTLINHAGERVTCSVVAGEEVYVSGLKVPEGHEAILLPGGTVTWKRDRTDIVSFLLTTNTGPQHRSPVGKIRFDRTARSSDFDLPPLSEQAARIPAPPALPELQPFPIEQLIVPLMMVAVLWFATRSLISLLLTPIAAAIPIFTYIRQQFLAKRRYQKARDEWVRRLESTSDELTKRAGEEEQRLYQDNPDAEWWARRAYRRLAGLWARTPERGDFLRVCLGYGQLLSRYESRLAEGQDANDPDFLRIMYSASRLVSTDAVRPRLVSVPITVSLREHHLGLAGPLELVGDVATAVLMQVVCAHAPGTVGIAALLPASDTVRRRYDWLKWLPHTTAGSTLLPAERVFAGRERCDAFLAAMRVIHQERHAHRLDEAGDNYALVIVHEAAEIDMALLAEVCALSNNLVRVVWLGSSKDTAPQLVTTLVEVQEDEGDSQDSTGVGWSGDAAVKGNRFPLFLYRGEPARSARGLAPLYDPRASGANAGIPATIPLGAVTAVESIRYASLPRRLVGRSLAVPLGFSESGVFELDFVPDGPHVLVGGTTGSGKSELLQTMVCGLISRFSPAEVNLFLVDFKGGATFEIFADLPHTIGYVNDLDQRNANRALAFLRAELRRREQAFQEFAHAKDYMEYLGRALKKRKRDTLPRLVVIFDEFAALVQEKEFDRTTMPAVIDVARRGRSLGVHLVLATQRPTRDVVVPDVRANVNARIALRTLSPEDSETILDHPDAMRIPRALPGRAMVRLEGSTIIEFQTAYAGALHAADAARAPIHVADFVISGLDDRAPEVVDDKHDEEEEEEGPRRLSQLERIVQVVNEQGWADWPGSKRLLPPLEATRSRVVPVDTSPRGAGLPQALPGPGQLTIGAVDLPHLQEQRPVNINLDRGGVCVVGPNRSGRSTALLTIAQRFAASYRGQPFGTVCLDAGEDLSRWLAAEFGEVTTIPLSRHDYVTRAIDQLCLLLRSRMVNDDETTETISYVESNPILFLIDGYDTLTRSQATPAFAMWRDRLVELITLGRRYRIYTAVATGSLRDLDLPVASAMSEIYQLHAQYADSGVAAEDRLPGFGLDSQSHLIQFFDRYPTTPSRSAATSDGRLVEFLAPDGWRGPSNGDGADSPAADGLLIALGIDELTRLPFRIDIVQQHVLVIGRARSGRTSLLVELARQVAEHTGCAVGILSARRAIDRMPSWLRALSPEEIDRLRQLTTAAERCDFAADRGITCLPDGRPLLLIDDCYAIESDTLGGALIDLYHQSHAQFIAATTAAAATKSLLTAAMRLAGPVVYVRPAAVPSDADDGWRVTNIALKHRPGLVYQRGDAIIQTDAGQVLVHLTVDQQADR